MTENNQPKKATKKTGRAGKPDTHKANRMGRIREPLAKQIDKLAESRATDFTEEINRAVREMLEREGLWPPRNDLPRNTGES